MQEHILREAASVHAPAGGAFACISVEAVQQPSDREDRCDALLPEMILGHGAAHRIC